MASGPLRYDSIDFSLLGGRVFGNTYKVVTNDYQFEGIGIEASLGADVDIQMEFTPVVIPTGDPKLVAEVMSLAETGIATINPRSKSFAPGVERDVAKSTYATEEGDSTFTFVSGGDTKSLQNKITLANAIPVAGETFHMYLQLRQSTSRWTLAQVSTWKFYIIYE